MPRRSKPLIFALDAGVIVFLSRVSFQFVFENFWFCSNFSFFPKRTFTCVFLNVLKLLLALYSTLKRGKAAPPKGAPPKGGGKKLHHP